jgi:hypothetical protein
MARNGITYESVAGAANVIRARGIEPTISAIRAALNNEGSFSTISKHLEKWRASESAKVEAPPVPEAVENATLAAMATIWNLAHKEARGELAALREDSRVERARLLAEQVELLAENDRLEQALLAAEAVAREQAATAQQLAAVQGELAATRRLHAELLASLKRPASPRKPPAKT